MAIDNYTANKSFIFEHKERTPHWILLLDILFMLGTFIMIIAYICLVPIRASGHEFTGSQANVLIISFIVFCCFGLFVAILNSYYSRFNFHYIVTLNENSFTIGFPTRNSVKTSCFYRKITYEFREKSQVVYIHDVAGIKYAFRYDEPFRKFLEEIQIK